MPCFGPRVQPEYIGIKMSPWSQKSRWALAYSGVQYTYTEKGLLEWPLRMRLGISSSGEGGDSDGKLTFPMLAKKDGQLLRQSLSIVKWSQTEAGHLKHIGGKEEGTWNEAIDAWDAKGVQVMRYGRLQAFEFALKNDEAQIEVVKILGLPIPGDALKLKMGRTHTLEISEKYKDASESASLEEVKQILDELLATLKKQEAAWNELTKTGKLAASGPYLVDGCFTYADICMVLGLHTLRPFPEFPLGMLRPIFGKSTKELADAYEPLFAWGQAILAAHLPEDLKAAWAA